MRLDLALIQAHPGFSRRKAQAAIRKGQVSVDGRTVHEPGQACSPSATISFDPNRKAERRIRSSIPILYEDAHVVVVDKPAGLLSVPTTKDAEREDTAVSRVAQYVALKHPRRRYVGLVHRLDQGTSGVLAFALDPKTRAALRSLFRAHRVGRRYVALVAGEPQRDSGVVNVPIRDAYVSGRRAVAREGEPSHEARTRWRVVERFGDASLVEIELDTGRQHQIRIHMAHIGHPVLGDAVYGRGAARGTVRAGRPLLHARHLGFVHPATGQSVGVDSAMPGDFQTALRTLRGRARSVAAPPVKSRSVKE